MVATLPRLVADYKGEAPMNARNEIEKILGICAYYIIATLLNPNSKSNLGWALKPAHEKKLLEILSGERKLVMESNLTLKESFLNFIESDGSTLSVPGSRKPVYWQDIRLWFFFEGARRGLSDQRGNS